MIDSYIVRLGQLLGGSPEIYKGELEQIRLIIKEYNENN